MYELDIPADADPSRVYGTPEFERARSARAAKSTIPRRHAVEPGIPMPVTDVRGLLKHYAEVHRRLNSGVRVVAPQPVPPSPPEPDESRPAGYKITFSPLVEEPGDDEAQGRLTIALIIGVVARHYGVDVCDVLSDRRTHKVAWPRQVACYLAKSLTLHSLPMIGRHFGGRDHTTILHAVRKLERLIAEDDALAAEIDGLRKTLTGVVQ